MLWWTFPSRVFTPAYEVWPLLILSLLLLATVLAFRGSQAWKGKSAKGCYSSFGTQLMDLFPILTGHVRGPSGKVCGRFCRVLLCFMMFTETSSSVAKIRATSYELATVAEPVYDSSGELVRVGGLAMDYMDWIAERLHYKYELVRFYNKSVIGTSLPSGQLVNGTWDGLMGEIVSDVADIALAAFGNRAIYLAYAELTFPFSESAYAIFIPFPNEKNVAWAYVKPFTLPVWLLLMLSAVSVASVLALKKSGRANKGTKGNSSSFGTKLLYLIAVLTGQGGDWQHKGKSLILPGVAWSLLALVMVNAYNGLLISFLTTSKQEPLVSSIQDLIQKPHVPFYVVQNSVISLDLQSAETGAYKILGDAIRLHPNRIAHSFEDCIAKLIEGSSVCLLDASVGEAFAKREYLRYGKCVISSVDKDIRKFVVSFALVKKSSFYPPVNKAMLEAHQLGMYMHWRMKYSGQNFKCDLRKTATTNVKALSLHNFGDLFLLLGMGCCFSLLVLILEQVHYRNKLSKCK